MPFGPAGGRVLRLKVRRRSDAFAMPAGIPTFSAVGFDLSGAMRALEVSGQVLFWNVAPLAVC